MDDEEIPCFKTNRVFATRDHRFGTLYKVKKSTNGIAKIEGIPSNCIISNNLKISVDKIDKMWYCDIATQRIQEYIGGKKMATKATTKVEKPTEKKEVVKTETKPMNVFEKILRARIMFAEANPKKSGLNRHQEFKYFELSDIVPVKNKIFAELKLYDQIVFYKKNLL